MPSPQLYELRRVGPNTAKIPPYNSRSKTWRRILTSPRPYLPRVSVKTPIKVHRRPSGRKWRVTKVWSWTTKDSIPHRISRYSGEWY